MYRVFKNEMYSAMHSRVLFAVFIAIVAFSVLITSYSVSFGKLHLVRVFVDSAGEDPLLQERYSKAIQAVIDKNYYARYHSGDDKFMIEVGAEYLLEPGGVLYEQYGWLLNERYEYLQYIGNDFFPADAENVFETWRFSRIIDSFDAVFITGIIFFVFFLGKDFKRRGYSAYILAGCSRIEVVTGKYLAYLVSATVLSLTMLMAAIWCFVPSALVIGVDYISRCMCTRLIINIGLLSLPAIFPFIFKDIIKSMAAAYLFCILFFSNRQIIDTHLLDVYRNQELWERMFSPSAVFPVMLTTIGILAAAYIGSYLLFRRTQLK